MDKHGIYIDDEHTTDKGLWLIFYYEGKQIWRGPLSGIFRTHLEPAHNLDIKSGEIERGFQPETAFAKLALSKVVDKDLNKA
jgi:hypothetical protein